MEIKASTENGRVPVTILHVDGNIDSATHDIFKAKADEVIRDGARYILVDLSHVPFVSSAGLRSSIKNSSKLAMSETSAAIRYVQEMPEGDWVVVSVIKSKLSEPGAVATGSSSNVAQ